MTDFTDWTQEEMARRASVESIEATGSLLVKADNVFSRDYEGLAQGTANQILVSQGAGANPAFVTDITVGTLTITTRITTGSNPLILEPLPAYPIQGSTGGDTRGTNSLDLQHVRALATQVASGQSSVICGGDNNTASANYSFVGGGLTNTGSGARSFVGSGSVNTVAALYSAIVCGFTNTITSDGTYSFIGGGGTNGITGDYCVVAGGRTNSANTGSYIFVGGGLENTVTGSYSMVSGGRDNTITTALYCAIVGGWGNELVAGAYASSISGGLNNTSTGLQSTICGGSNNIINAASNNNTIGGGLDNIITGDYNMVCGGRDHEIDGSYSTVCGGYTNDITGNYSTICGGYQNAITESYSVIIGGVSSEISGDRSTICGGTQHDISGSFSMIGGGTFNTITANYAGILCGNRAIAEHYGEQAHASGQFSAIGDAQYMNLVARNGTNGVVPAILYLNGASATERITIGTSTSWYFTIKVIGRQTNGDFTVNGWHFEGLATRDAGNISILNVSTVHSFINDVTNWACSITADTTNQALQINVTGATSESILWVAKIELVKAEG